MLLAVNANVNARDSIGRTALLEAAKAGHADILAQLLARGARLALEPQRQAQVWGGEAVCAEAGGVLTSQHTIPL
jgi:ankyrin repeat protein